MGMFGLGGDSSSSATDNRIQGGDSSPISQGNSLTTTGQSLALRAGNNALQVQSNGFGLGTGAKYLAGQAADLTGARATGNINVSTSDPDVLKAALTAMGSNSQATLKSISDVADRNAAASAQTFNDALSQLAALATTQSTGGASLAAGTIKQMLLWGMAILASVVVAYLYFRRK